MIRRLLPAPLLAFASPAHPATDPLLPDGFVVQHILENLDQPTDLEFLPDGRMLILERETANVLLFRTATFTVETIATLPDVQASPTGEQGLLGVAVDPEWPDRPYLYFHYNHIDNQHIYLSRYTAVGELSDPLGTFALTDRYDVLPDIPSPYSGHNAGTVEFGIDGTLYVSVGDGFLTFCAAQDSSTMQGCILRLDVSGLPASGPGPPSKASITPPDNPFAGGGSEEAGLVFCFGLRNPFRFSIHPVTGAVLIGDVGNALAEELNVAWGGENFGWPFREGPFIDTTLTECSEPGGPGGSSYEDPVYWYDYDASGIAVIGGPVYRPAGGDFDFPPEYDGVWFFADFGTCLGPINVPCGFIRALAPDSSGTWSLLDPVPGQYDAENWAPGERFITDLEVGPDGALYYVDHFRSPLRFDLPGGVSRIVPEDAVLSAGDPDPGIRPLVSPNPTRRSAGATIRFEAPEPGAFPVTVFDVSGRMVARVDHRARAAGAQRVFWNGLDGGGARLPAGVYYLRVGGGVDASAEVTLLP